MKLRLSSFLKHEYVHALNFSLIFNFRVERVSTSKLRSHLIQRIAAFVLFTAVRKNVM